jgi:hypothetical protein
MPNVPDKSLRHRKIRDRALILPLVGLLLLTPPLANIFELDARLNGVPIVLVYVFAVWAGLVAGAILLSRGLRDADPGPPLEETTPATRKPGS